MALQKSINNNFNIPATYWKIVDLNVNWLTKIAHIVICGWQDQTARENGNQPLDSRSFDWSGDSFPFIETEPQNERQIAYDSIKTQTIINEDGNILPGEFSDAINV